MENPNYDEIIRKLKDELTHFKSQTDDFVLLIEKAMGLSDKAIRDMRKIVLAEVFSEIEGEIYFFKHIKPQVSSKLIFYTELFNMESYRLKADTKIQTTYFRNVVQKFCAYLKENKEFYQYYKRGKTFSDHLYFTCGNTDRRIHADNIINHIDPKFSTGYDLTLAKNMAYEKLMKYTSNEIEKLNNQVTLNSGAEWTGQNVDAAELIYALVSLGVINNGKIGIKELILIP